MLSPASEQIAVTIVTSLIILVIVGTLGYWLYKRLLSGRECSAMDDMYGTLNGSIRSINSTDPNCKYTLKDYYIKTAVNACCSGSYRHDFVNMCALKDVLKQGVRCVDFEVFSIDDQPVVAVSMSDNTHVKESYNSIPMSEILPVLRDYAFSGSTAPNPKDPLIMHLRFKSSNLPMYDNFAKLLESFDSVLLGSEYSFENQGQNFGDVPLLDLCGKIVIIVDRSNTTFLGSKPFYEYVNMCSNSVFMRLLQYTNVQYSPDMGELTEFNKRGMTLVVPTAGDSDPANASPIVLRETGCQFIGMRYQLFDSNLETSELAFDKATYAFDLKPEALRYIPVVIPDPPAQDPKLSYENRTVEADYYKFTI